MPVSTPVSTKERAMQVVLEIIRQSTGNEITGKTRLFKAFYFAHLFYARDSAKYLTEWPIVKMTYGPGIDKFKLLITELESKRAVATEPVEVGPYRSEKYRAVGDGSFAEPLGEDARKAIGKAVDFVADKTGGQVSEYTHEFSVSWDEAKEGDELNIYIDLLSEEERDERRAKMMTLQDDISRAWAG